MFDTVIQGGTVYTPKKTFVGDIGIVGEKIDNHNGIIQNSNINVEC